MLVLGCSLFPGGVMASRQEATTPDAQVTRGQAVSFPWVFKDGTDTARLTAKEACDEIARKAGYANISDDVSKAAWTKLKLPKPGVGLLPSRASLKAFGKAVKADKILSGSISWHTRSIWVNAGPKTVSTATVNAYVHDVKSGAVVFKRTAVKGRSDERSSGYKIAAAVLFTPLVTAVSGGPATPREQRAVQIALGKAFSNWVRTSNLKK